MMLALGQFVFSLSTLAYQSLARQSAWRHASNSRVGARSAYQFVGPGDDTVNLDGVLLPELTGAGLVTLDPLTDMANRGDAMPLVDGTGVLYGAFVITAINTTATVFFADGTPRRIEFQLALQRVDDNQVATPASQPLGTIDSGAGVAGFV